MPPELEQRIADCWDATELEDIYLPYKPKRRTRAQVAREQGLEPLAMLLLRQRGADPEAAARRFVSADVPDTAAALKGAQDIIAEMVSEDERSRQTVRGCFRRTAVITSKVVKAKADTEEAAKFSDYFDWSELLKRCSSHRLLAMRRGEAEGILRVSITVDDEEMVERLQQKWKTHPQTPPLREGGSCARIIDEAVAEGYKRLLCPSIENEFAASSKERADEEAIRVFAENLRQLLLGAPLGQKRVMGIDPGFRTGCKVVCLDAQGNLLHHETIFPHPPVRKPAEAAEAVAEMIRKYKVEAIAIGNGTASRETKGFIEMVVEQTGSRDARPSLFVVSEDGASVYSASKVAREEFPDEDVTVRGAVSIGRRLMDPLAELVKIDPKSIGVGQYQHDVDQGKLKKSLDQTVESCVNSVGVPTLTDIMKELEKPGRDPRTAIEAFEFDSRVASIDDLVEGMELPGIVTNITNFGAFVDIGVHQDGLVHISQLANKYVSHPTDVVKLHQHVRVRVTEVDRRRNRISLSMKGLN